MLDIDYLFSSDFSEVWGISDAVEDVRNWGRLILKDGDDVSSRSIWASLTCADSSGNFKLNTKTKINQVNHLVYIFTFARQSYISYPINWK